MRTVRPYQDGDLDGFALIAQQRRDFSGPMSPRTAAKLLSHGGRAFTLRDGDTVLLEVDQVGAACHTGDHTCFDADELLGPA